MNYETTYMDAKSFNPNPDMNLIINTNSIKLSQQSLNITIDITSDTLDKLEAIEINGFKFVKETTT